MFMGLDATTWLVMLCAGAFAGFWAGLLGVGGGLIIVPIMVWILSHQGVGPEYSQHLAIGTSFAVMVFTSFSSVLAQHKRGAVRWDLVWKLAPWMVVGTFVGASLAKYVPGLMLQSVFVVFAFIIAAQTFMDFKPKASRQMPGTAGSVVSGGFIGMLSSWVGIGGGSLSVPFMLFCNVPIVNAVGTSAAFGWPIALAGCIGYLVNGWAVPGLPTGAAGFVYLPALIGLAIGTVTFAPIGVKVAHKLPPRKLKLAFAMMLTITACQMLWKILHTI